MRRSSKNLFFNRGFDLTRCFLIVVAILSVVGTSCKKRNPKSSTTESDTIKKYSFGGACGSRGFWTQTAVSRADEVASTLERLRDNPKCKKMYDAIKTMGDIKATYTPDPGVGHRYSRMMTLSREITTLKSYLDLSDFRRGDILALLLDRTLEQKNLQIESDGGAQSVKAIIEKENGDLETARNIAASIENRVQVSAQVGLDRIQNYFQALSESAECLDANPALNGINLIGQSSQVLGAFASGDPVTASKTSSSLFSLANFLRQSKYNAAIKKSADAVFAESMGCMMESVAYSYCAARDAQAILARGGNQLQKHVAEHGMNQDSAFWGYYVMTHHLPIVTRWIQTVLSNYVPRRRSDAVLINGIFQIPVDVEIYSNTFNAIYAERMKLFLQEKDKTAKASTMVELVKALNDEIAGAYFPRRGKDSFGGGAPTGVTKIPNFFRQSTPRFYLPFKLIGLKSEDIPPECVQGSKKSAGNPMTFYQWAKSSGEGFKPIFFQFEEQLNDGKISSTESVQSLPTIIRKQLDGMIGEGRAAAADYFWRNIPIDIEAVAADAGSGQLNTAMTSLDAIRQFILSQMEQLRSERSSEAVNYIISLRDSYERIVVVLDAYKSYQDQAQDSDSAKKFLATVYEKLNLVFQGTSFLPMRMIGYVKRDMINKIKQQKMGTRALEPEILTLANDLAFDLIVGSLGSNGQNPQSGNLQLSSARQLNNAALSALDTAFGDKLKATISHLRNVALGIGDTSDRSINSDSYNRSRMDSRILPRSKSDGFLDRFYNYSMDKLEFVGPRAMIRRSLNPDLYPMPNPWRGPGYGEDEFGSYGNYWATLCALTLTLPRPGFYADVCEGAVLYSPYEKRGKNTKSIGPLSFSYNDWRKSFVDSQSNQNVQPSTQCAYYDISRRNQIYAMTLDHITFGDKGGINDAVIPLPDNSDHIERAFEQAAGEVNPARESKFTKLSVLRKVGKVPSNSTYCGYGGTMANEICGEYEKKLEDRGVAGHGAVALSCYDLKANTFYCCNGYNMQGALPHSSDAPCFKSLSDKNSFVPSLTDKDLGL